MTKEEIEDKEKMISEIIQASTDEEKDDMLKNYLHVIPNDTFWMIYAVRNLHEDKD